jgi:hypothetical protein
VRLCPAQLVALVCEEELSDVYVFFSVLKKPPVPSFDLPENTFLCNRKAALQTPVKISVESQLTVVKRDRATKAKQVGRSVEKESEISMEPEAHRQSQEKTTVDKILNMNRLEQKDDSSAQNEAMDIDVDKVPENDSTAKPIDESIDRSIDESTDKSIDESMDEVSKTKEPQIAEYSCDCGVKFSSVGWLVRHMRGCVEVIICDLCRKTFKSSKTLKKHKKMIHTNALKCDQCDKTFTTPKKLVRHTRSVHEATILCEICSSTFKNKNTLRDHKKKSHNAKLNAKEQPNIEEKRQDKKMTKAKDEHGGSNKQNTKQLKSEYHCLLCPKSFGSSSGLRKHRVAHKKLIDQSNTNVKSDVEVSLENNAVADDLERIEVVFIEDGNEISMGTAVVIGPLVSGEQLLLSAGEQASVTQGGNSGKVGGSIDSEHMDENIISERIVSSINNANTGDRNNNEGAGGSEQGGFRNKQWSL